MLGAVYYGPKDIRIEDMPDPVVGDEDIVVKVEMAGVCGTDVKTYLRGHPMFKPPCVLGHEFVGEVVTAGPRVQEISEGSRVVVAPYVPCGSCYFCHRDEMELCQNKDGLGGVFAQYVRVPKNLMEKGLIEIPRKVKSEDAVLAEPLACCLNALEDCDLRPGDIALIMGGGPMGQLLLQSALLCGVSKVIVSEPQKERRELAGELGAITVDPESQDLGQFIKEETRGTGAATVLIALGIPELIPSALHYACPGGTVNIFGGLPKGSQINIDPNIIHYQQVRLVGSFGFAPRHFAAAVELLINGRINSGKIISHSFPLERIQELLELCAKQEVLKAVVKP